jgi:hypothetical protein
MNIGILKYMGSCTQYTSRAHGHGHAHLSAIIDSVISGLDVCFVGIYICSTCTARLVGVITYLSFHVPTVWEWQPENAK